MIQLTLIQIDNYGPWTTDPLPRREADLQILQASIYRDLQQQFSAKKTLVFPMRCDNMLAATNGMNEEDHRRIMESINNRYPVTISMAVACGENALEAQRKATLILAKEGGAKEQNRMGVLKIAGTSSGKVQIAHFDINDIARHTNTDVYRSYMKVIETHVELVKQLEAKNALLFFMAGDNFISVCNGLSKGELDEILEKTENKTDVKLKAGIGIADNAERATWLASMGLKEIRTGKSKEKVVLKQE
jgi:GTP cyclohydrolase IIa